MENNYIKNFVSLALIIFSFILLFNTRGIEAENTLPNQVSGKILLQVEANGEAWYIYPNDKRRYFLGRPADAFDIMKELSQGISNDDLKKIPVAEANFIGPDTDEDGLSDAIEISLGTDLGQPDTDFDGYLDIEEVINHYNPDGELELERDEELVKRLAGWVVLQIEKNGEAWYINPDGQKRYYMGRPADAFNLMRRLGLGISNENIALINEYQIKPESKPSQIAWKYTAPISSSPSSRKYTDPDKGFSFEYPSTWTVKKYEESPNVIHLTDATKDYVLENKAVIAIFGFETDIPLEDVNKTRIAAIEKELSVDNSDHEYNGLKSVESIIIYNKAKERTVTVEISEDKFVTLSLTTNIDKYSFYSGKLNTILNSLTSTE
jgi:hypothetical protein